MQKLTLIILTGIALVLTSSARAELLYAVNGNNQLLTFDSAAPGVILSRTAISGTGGDAILNIDFRPATGQLFALSGNNNLYTLNLATGAASFLGATGISGGFDYGFDFNPMADRIRVVTDSGGNFRINQTIPPPFLTTDTNLTYAAGDPNAGVAPQIAGAAYTNNIGGAGSTQLYYIDLNLNTLALTTNPNGGVLTTVGALGFDVTGLMGFDISGVSGLAFASLSLNGVTSSLYTINLATGAATLVPGGIGAGETILDISAAPVPEPSTYFLLALGAIGFFFVRRRMSKISPTMVHRGGAICAALCIAGSASAQLQGFRTSVQPYAASDGRTPASQFNVTALLSVNDAVPLTGGAPGSMFRMVGIPDGMGAMPNGDGTATLFVSHELSNTANSQPVVGGDIIRGAFVSNYRLASDASILSGKLAFTQVFQDDTLIGPIATTTNATPAFIRFCAASLSGREVGFDRPIYFANEESTAGTFDPRGAQSVAIFDNNGVGEAHALSRLGFFPWETTLIMPRRDALTVAMCMEDGPATLDNQLYMYVGRKQRGAASILSRNGLNNGALYAFRSSNLAMNSEATFTTGSVTGDFVLVTNDASTLNQAQLEAATDGVNAFTFVRVEDGSFDAAAPTSVFYFNTTGSGAVGTNVLGRVYKLTLDPADPRKPNSATLSIISNGDTIDGGPANTGDTAFSPDNMENNGSLLLVNEDGTAQSRVEMSQRGRDGLIWSFNLLNNFARQKEVTLNPPGRDGVAVGPGIWETSGTVDTTAIYGPNTWIFDVQAHAPTAAPAPNTVEDGQILLLTPRVAAKQEKGPQGRAQ